MTDYSQRVHKVGTPPGTLLYVGKRKLQTPRITLVRYSPDEVTEAQVTAEEACAPPAPGTVTWINVEGLHDVELVRVLGESFGLDRLVMEDILDTGHRPKVEEYGHYLYVVGRYFWYDDAADELHSEQISLILAPGLLMTFCEGGWDILAPIRERLRQATSRLRTRGADYLAYLVLDGVVDSYFVALDALGQDVERLEERLLQEPDEQLLREVSRAKNQTAQMRRSAWPMREVLGRLQHEDSELLDPHTSLFLRDASDHIIQIVDTLESMRDLLASMLDIYLSAISNRMNEIMKVLTIIATIFIPITFVAGVYGMNFHYMPELTWWWGYPAALGLMLTMALGMVAYFRWRRWL